MNAFFFALTVTVSLIDLPLATVAIFFVPAGETTLTLFTAFVAFAFFLAALAGVIFVENTKTTA